MLKKILVVVLCVCMLFNFTAQPVHAMGAEGIIIGGAAAAGVTLTVGQVALILAAGFGLIYAVTHADEIGAMLESALNSAVNNDETRQEQLTNWKSNALAGLIAITTAPAWIKNTIGNFAATLHETPDTSNAIIPVATLPAYTATKTAMFWTTGGTTKKYDKDVTILRLGSIDTVTSNGELFYSIGSYYVAVSTVSFSGAGSQILNIDGQKYYYHSTFSGLNPSAETELSGDNLLAYEAVSTLPQKSDIERNIIEKYPNFTGNIYAFMIKAWLDGMLNGPNSSICPDATVGGVGNALGEHSIDNINIPDINVGQSDLLVPDNTASINDTLNDVLSRLEQQELTWQQYMDDVAVGTPTVSIPAEGTQTGTLEYPLTDTGVSDTPIDTTQPDNPSTTIPEGIEPYTIDLRNFFPFCIPFDIVKFVNTLCAEPEAPCFTWGFATPDGGTEELEVDLAVFDPVAEILRSMELLLFCIGLAFLTRALIRG